MQKMSGTEVSKCTCRRPATETETGATHTATNDGSRHFGPTLFAKANGTEPGKAKMADSVCDELA